jgi:arsenate reductase
MKLTTTHWADLAVKIGVSVRDLVNTEDSDFLQKFGKMDQLSEDDWLKLLVNNPLILKAPIVMKGNKIVMMCNPQDMLYFVK